jgi:ketosteroid isomerase-like protein
MSEQNKKVVIEFIEAMSAGDVARAEPCVAPNARAVAMGRSKMSGERSRDQMIGTLGAFTQLMPGGLNPKFIAVMAEGDHVVAEFEGNAKLANGEPYCNEYAMVFTLKDGKITLLNEYFCTKLADTLYPVVQQLGLGATASVS